MGRKQIKQKLLDSFFGSAAVQKEFEKMVQRLYPTIPEQLSILEAYISVLRKRGVEIRDWDNKEKILQQVRIIGGKAYFLAAGDEKPNGGNGE